MGEHDGHRSRLKARLAGGRMEEAADRLLLEQLLCYSIKRRDVCPLASGLIDTYGDLGALFEQPVGELTSNLGVGDNTAALIALVGEASRRGGEERRVHEIRSPEDAWRFVTPRFRFASGRLTYLLCLDDRLRPIRCLPVADDERLHVTVGRMATAAGARTVMIVKDLGGDMHTLTPWDLSRAKQLGVKLSNLGIVLLDYIGVSGEFYSSIAERGVFRDEPEVRCRYRASYFGLMSRDDWK